MARARLQFILIFPFILFSLSDRPRLRVNEATPYDFHKCSQLVARTFFPNQPSKIIECLEIIKIRSGLPETKHFISSLEINKDTIMEEYIVGFIEVSITSDKCFLLGSNDRFKCKRSV